MMDVEVVLKRFDTPDEVREMPLGRFEVVRIGGLTIGRATYQPGWRWSTHVGPGVGASRCSVEHVGLVVSGVATAAFADGRGTGSMRLNYSAQSEDEIREGIRRIGAVIDEQVGLYETITGEHRLPEPGPEGVAEPGAVLPFHRRPPGR